MAKSDVRVIGESEPPLYLLFAESPAQVGVGSTAVYEGLCFDLETFVFDTDGSDVLQPLVDDGTAAAISTVDELVREMNRGQRRRFDRERFFKPDAAENILQELKTIPER